MTRPKSAFDECDDFFTLAIECYILVASMKYLKMTSLDNNPSSDIIPEDVWTHNVWTHRKGDRKTILMEVAKNVVTDNVDFSMHTSSPAVKSNKSDNIQMHSIH